MPTWLLITLGVYFAAVVVFIIAIYMEAPKHNAQVNVAHYLVAFVWPFWAVWYTYTVISEFVARKRRK